MDKREHILELIYAERSKQDKKWGYPRYLSDPFWYTILGEEVGEIARGILEHDVENLKDELVQVAAVCVAWLQNIMEE